MKNGRMCGQINASLLSLGVGVILIVAVLIPVTQAITSDLALTGSAKLLTNMIVPILALLALILVGGEINK